MVGKALILFHVDFYKALAGEFGRITCPIQERFADFSLITFKNRMYDWIELSAGDLFGMISLTCFQLVALQLRR